MLAFHAFSAGNAFSSLKSPESKSELLLAFKLQTINVI